MILPIQTLSLYERSINSSSLCAEFPLVRTFSMDEGGILLGRNKNNFYPEINQKRIYTINNKKLKEKVKKYLLYDLEKK